METAKRFRNHLPYEAAQRRGASWQLCAARASCCGGSCRPHGGWSAVGASALLISPRVPDAKPSIGYLVVNKSALLRDNVVLNLQHSTFIH